MLTHDRRVQRLAICLSAVAGYVDALGFLAAGGFFVSFMSGNSTRLAVGLAERSLNAVIAAALIATFVLGVVLGSLVGRRFKARRRMAVLAFVALLLASAAALAALEGHVIALGCMALAMGAENAVFEREGEVSIGLTYMTGTLVKVGQRIAGALLGGARFAWAPYLLLWAGLVAGAVLGASIYPLLRLQGLWIAAASAGALSFAASRMGPDASDR